jgi:DNA-directed RNA polymerase specialized sigma subunit
MASMTKSLTTHERFIIEQDDQLGHTMREIGEMLALTESRVCQIHSNIMGHLRGRLDRKQDNLMA